MREVTVIDDQDLPCGLSARCVREDVPADRERRNGERDHRESPRTVIGIASEEQPIAHALITGRICELASLSVEVPGRVPAILYQMWRSGAMLLDELRPAVCAVWTGSRDPVSWQRGHGLGPRGWVRLFQAAEYVHRVEPTTAANGQSVDLPYSMPPQLCARPTGNLTVWRGATETRRRGMSWTLYPRCAEHFARVAGEHGPAELLRANIPGHSVLAAFADGREQEIVVDPGLLPRVIDIVERWPDGALRSKEMRSIRLSLARR